MTGKASVIFPGFQGFPGAVGTLRNILATYEVPMIKPVARRTVHGQRR